MTRFNHHHCVCQFFVYSASAEGCSGFQPLDDARGTVDGPWHPTETSWAQVAPLCNPCSGRNLQVSQRQSLHSHWQCKCHWSVGPMPFSASERVESARDSATWRSSMPALRNERWSRWVRISIGKVSNIASPDGFNDIALHHCSNQVNAKWDATALEPILICYHKSQGGDGISCCMYVLPGHDPALN